jgi:hypothetical protein
MMKVTSGTVTPAFALSLDHIFFGLLIMAR